MFRIGAVVGRSAQRVARLPRSENSQLAAAASFILVTLVSAVLVLAVEEGRNPAVKHINGMDNALWWSISTVSTVGYGDVVPATTAGRSLALVPMIAGSARSDSTGTITTPRGMSTYEYFCLGSVGTARQKCPYVESTMAKCSYRVVGLAASNRTLDQETASMDIDTARTTVIAAITELAPAAGTADDAKLVDDLGFDSLKLLELSLVLEEQLRIAIPESDLERWEFLRHGREHDHVRPESDFVIARLLTIRGRPSPLPAYVDAVSRFLLSGADSDRHDPSATKPSNVIFPHPNDSQRWTIVSLANVKLTATRPTDSQSVSS